MSETWANNPERPMFVVDWDGTCITEEWPGMGDWLPGAIDALNELSSIGKTVIYSVRCSTHEIDGLTPRSEMDIAFENMRVRNMLNKAGLEHIEIYPPDRGKPPGMYFIDDRGVRFTGDWNEILDFVKGGIYA